MSPMSKETLSPSRQATGFTRGLATKLFDIGEFGIIKSPVFQNVPTADLDAFVKEVGPDMRCQFVALVERRFEVHINCYRIPVNYGVPNAIQAAIDENDFGYKYVGVNVADIPLGGSGETVEMVREVHFGEIMYNRDLPAALRRKGIEAGFPNGYVFANPLTSLKFAKKNPEKQVEAPRGILFYIGGQLCDLALLSDGDKRGLDVDRYSPGSPWHGDVRFLVVPAPGPAAVPA